MSRRRPPCEERIARARALASARPAAAEVLDFYAALAAYQQSLARACSLAVRSGNFDPPGQTYRTLLDVLDLESILDLVSGFLAWLPGVAPAPLAQSAVEMRQIAGDEWRRLAASYLHRGPARPEFDPAVLFVIEAVLQPFAEQAAMAMPDRPADRTSPECPLCRQLPVAGALREEGHGARRTLVCGLCLSEREYLRVVCPGCGEQNFDALPVFTAEQFPHVRIDACDRCRRYLKTIDLTKDGLAVPVVDDLATPSLDLWARDRGYQRLRPNLLGIGA